MVNETLENLCAYVCTFQKDILARKTISQVIIFNNETWNQFVIAACNHIESSLQFYIKLHKSIYDSLCKYKVISENYEVIYQQTYQLFCLKTIIESEVEYFKTGNSKNIKNFVEEINFFKSQVQKSSLLEVHKSFIQFDSLKNKLFYEKKHVEIRGNPRNLIPEIFSCLSVNGIEMLYEQFTGENQNMTSKNEYIFDPSQSLVKSNSSMKLLTAMLSDLSSDIKKIPLLNKTTFSSQTLKFRIYNTNEVF